MMKPRFVNKLPFTLALMIGFCFLLITVTYGNGNTGRRIESWNMEKYELEDNGLMYSDEGREFLSYLIECALPENASVFFEIGGTKYEYEGAMDMTPRWLDSPLTESEERWISACMLARTNHFGHTVQISMRAEHSDLQSLQVSEEERNDFTIHEGDFWGNLFVDEPVAFVERGTRTLEEAEDPGLQKRVCTEIDESLSTQENLISRCGFILSNVGSESEARSVCGQKYQEYISVYLKPDKNN